MVKDEGLKSCDTVSLHIIPEWLMKKVFHSDPHLFTRCIDMDGQRILTGIFLFINRQCQDIRVYPRY